MDEYSYYVIGIEEIETGKKSAYTERIHNSNNLLYAFNQPKGVRVIHINACDTRKKAEWISAGWNNGYKANGNYMYA